MAEIGWHRRETRRQTENTNVMPIALEGLLLLDKNSCGFARVVLQESPTPFAPRRRALALCLVADRRQAQDMALALMMPLVVTMRHLLRQRMGERRFPTADPPRATCLRDRPYPAFRRGVAMRRPRRQWPTRHPGGGDVLLQDGAVLPLRLMQERLPHRQAPPRLHRAMAGDLHHPLDMRMGRYARDRELPAVSARHECTGLTDRSRGWVIHPRLPASHPLAAEPSRHRHLEQVSPRPCNRVAVISTFHRIPTK
jgi:hypothetical protein